jgi:C1A family cysteine protease
LGGVALSLPLVEMSHWQSFHPLQIDKGTDWEHFHQTLLDLGRELFSPSSIDLRPELQKAGIEVYHQVRYKIRSTSAVADENPRQGKLNACTANALCTVWRYAQTRVDPGFTPSRLFLYYNERSAEGTTSQDSGACISDGCKSLATYGVCSEQKWAYDENGKSRQPPQEAYDEAKQHVIHTPAQIVHDRSSGLKDSLIQHKPFIVGLAVYPEFMGDEVRKTGIVPMPAPGSECHGYHAAVCVGYDDHKQVWIFRNSWGPEWGDQG